MHVTVNGNGVETNISIHIPEMLTPENQNEVFEQIKQQLTARAKALQTPIN